MQHQRHQQTFRQTTIQHQPKPAITAAVEQLSSTPVTEVCHCLNCVELGPVPVTIPGKRWVPVWSLQRQDTAMAKPTSNKSFDELLLDKMKGPTNKPAAKRKRCDFKTKVVTDKTYVDELKRLEKAGDEKKASKGKKGMKKKKAKKQIEFEDMDIGGNAGVKFEENEVGVDENEEEEENSEIMEETDEEIVEEDTDEEIDLLGDEAYLIALWKKLSPPEKEDDITNKWYGAIYEHKNKCHLYVGKAIRRFLYDEKGPVSSIELDCLKPRVGTGTVLESYDNARHDIDRFPLHNIIAGPLHVAPLRSNKWDIPKYQSLEERFNRVVKLHREELASVLTK